MKKSFLFPKKAAYLCLTAPFAMSLFASIIKNSESSDYIFVFVSLGILFIGIVFGVYSLFYYKKIKGILVPAVIGLLLHVFIVGVAYNSFNEYRARLASYILIKYIMANEEVSYEQVMIERIHSKIQIEKYIEKVVKNLIVKCPKCEILETKNYQALPEQYQGIFDNAQSKYTYVSIDMIGKKGIGDIRIFFPAADPQPSCQDLEEYVNLQKQAIGKTAIIDCKESKFVKAK